VKPEKTLAEDAGALRDFFCGKRGLLLRGDTQLLVFRDATNVSLLG